MSLPQQSTPKNNDPLLYESGEIIEEKDDYDLHHHDNDNNNNNNHDNVTGRKNKKDNQSKKRRHERDSHNRNEHKEQYYDNDHHNQNKRHKQQGERRQEQQQQSHHHRHHSSSSSSSKHHPIHQKTTQSQQQSQQQQYLCKTFDEMNLKKDLLKGIYAYGFERPSAIQQRAIRPIVCGHDVIAQSQSGTGKTAVFAIASLQVLEETSREVQGLILSPTRELAEQSQRVMQSLGDFMNVSIYLVS
jgi:hypothetical protein